MIDPELIKKLERLAVLKRSDTIPDQPDEVLEAEHAEYNSRRDAVIRDGGVRKVLDLVVKAGILRVCVPIMDEVKNVVEDEEHNHMVLKTDDVSVFPDFALVINADGESCDPW